MVRDLRKNMLSASKLNMVFFTLVKVFLMSVEKNGGKIDFDVRKIKVNVTRIVKAPIESSKFPIVKLNRLTDEEISKYARPKTTENELNSNQAGTYLTRSKKQKLSKEMSQPKSKTTLNENTNQTVVSMAHSSKRKNDIEATYMTRSKKPKLSKEMSQPMTEITPVNIVDEKQKVEVSLPANNIVAKFQYSINEIVWTKIRGFPHWPAKVIANERGKVSTRYEVLWLNDYRKSKVYESQMFKFYPNFEEFSAKFSTTIGLETAAKEALIYLAKMKK